MPKAFNSDGLDPDEQARQQLVGQLKALADAYAEQPNPTRALVRCISALTFVPDGGDVTLDGLNVCYLSLIEYSRTIFADAAFVSPSECPFYYAVLPYLEDLVRLQNAEDRAIAKDVFLKGVSTSEDRYACADENPVDQASGSGSDSGESFVSCISGTPNESDSHSHAGGNPEQNSLLNSMLASSVYQPEYFEHVMAFLKALFFTEVEDYPKALTDFSRMLFQSVFADVWLRVTMGTAVTLTDKQRWSLVKDYCVQTGLGAPTVHDIDADPAVTAPIPKEVDALYERLMLCLDQLAVKWGRSKAVTLNFVQAVSCYRRFVELQSSASITVYKDFSDLEESYERLLRGTFLGARFNLSEHKAALIAVYACMIHLYVKTLLGKNANKTVRTLGAAWKVLQGDQHLLSALFHFVWKCDEAACRTARVWLDADYLSASDAMFSACEAADKLDVLERYKKSLLGGKLSRQLVSPTREQWKNLGQVFYEDVALSDAPQANAFLLSLYAPTDDPNATSTSTAPSAAAVPAILREHDMLSVAFLVDLLNPFKKHCYLWKNDGALLAHWVYIDAHYGEPLIVLDRLGVGDQAPAKVAALRAMQKTYRLDGGVLELQPNHHLLAVQEVIESVTTWSFSKSVTKDFRRVLTLFSSLNNETALDSSDVPELYRDAFSIADEHEFDCQQSPHRLALLAHIVHLYAKTLFLGDHTLGNAWKTLTNDPFTLLTLFSVVHHLSDGICLQVKRALFEDLLAHIDAMIEGCTTIEQFDALAQYLYAFCAGNSQLFKTMLVHSSFESRLPRLSGQVNQSLDDYSEKTLAISYAVLPMSWEECQAYAHADKASVQWMPEESRSASTSGGVDLLVSVRVGEAPDAASSSGAGVELGSDDGSEKGGCVLS